MLKPLLASLLLTTPMALGETLLSGAIYFDSENTLLEVQSLLKAGDTDGLARLFKSNHISEKVTENLEVILLLSDPQGVEFRFANNPTTYWTYPKFLTANAVKPAATPPPSPSLSPGPNSTLPADLPSSLTSSSIHLPGAMPTPTPAATPTPTPPPPIPTPTPKVRVAVVEDKEEDAPPKRDGQEDAGIVWHTVNGHRKWYSKKHPPVKPQKEEKDNNEEGVPESAKVWHLVNGRLKWYDKRNYHEVRRALPVAGTPLAGPPEQVSVPVPAAVSVTPTSQPIPYPATSRPNPVVPRALPARP